MSLLLHIVTPESTEEHQHVAYINLQTMQGEVGIRPGHMDIITSLSHGDIYREEEQKYDAIDSFKTHIKKHYVPGGIAHVKQNTVTIITSKLHAYPHHHI